MTGPMIQPATPPTSSPSVKTTATMSATNVESSPTPPTSAGALLRAAFVRNGEMIACATAKITMARMKPSGSDQLMENVFVSLRLADFWHHPDNRGWVVLFTKWAKSGTFRIAWKQTRDTFSIGFIYFCERRLGL